MHEISPKMLENQVIRSLLCVASPRLSKTGEGALQKQSLNSCSVAIIPSLKSEGSKELI